VVPVPPESLSSPYAASTSAALGRAAPLRDPLDIENPLNFVNLYVEIKVCAEQTIRDSPTSILGIIT